MKIFSYDKTFEGLLAAVFDAFIIKSFPTGFCGPGDTPPLTATDLHTVLTTPEKTLRVFAALQKKLSPTAMRSLLYAWLADLPGSDLSVFRYICKTLKAQASIEGDMADPEVWAITRLHRKVNKEKERYMGFVRFQKSCEGVYFASISPGCNVLPLLAGSFAERFHDQPWIIYDRVRHYGVMYRPGQTGGGFEEVFVDEKRLRDGFLREEFLAEGEMLLEDLWRAYHGSAAIKERANPRLQRNFMPKRFWSHLTEMRQTPRRRLEEDNPPGEYSV